MSIAIAVNHMTVTRFESTSPGLDRWGTGSNPRFLRRRSRSPWRKRSFASGQSVAKSRCRPLSSACKKAEPSILRQGLEVGLFGTYFLVFLASLWMLG